MSQGDYIQEDTRIINLSSASARYLNSTLKSDVVFDFKNILTEQPDIIHTTIGVVSAQIPVSYYTINEYNNILNTTFGSYEIYLGNYTASSIIVEMIPRITKGAPAIMQITIQKITGKLTFFCAEIRNFTFFSAGSTALSWLGFDPSLDYPSDEYGSLNVPYPLNLLGTQQLRINSTACGGANSNSSCLGESSLIAVIQSSAPPFGMILYNNQSSYSVLRNKRISSIDIQIMDENNNPIDFNGIDWTLTLQMTIYRRVALPNNETNYLRPILQTLSTIQQSLTNKPKASVPDVPAPDPQNLVPTPTDFNDDSNSLDVMLYNHVFP